MTSSIENLNLLRGKFSRNAAKLFHSLMLNSFII
nr:MAG TPA: hypothetical protein [Caudoviricetes sp.]